MQKVILSQKRSKQYLMKKLNTSILKTLDLERNLFTINHGYGTVFWRKIFFQVIDMHQNGLIHLIKSLR